jgi:hypothetical protein
MRERARTSLALAMQKVVGSNPIIRFLESSTFSSTTGNERVHGSAGMPKLSTAPVVELAGPTPAARESVDRARTDPDLR